ncbi:MAG TPA: sugar phosphate isomerase/epimerase, partial [Thermoprotei archaeon]|nr:sugar phosphate isomerase/epimerase [Thermoprotei archaeon]
MNVSVYSLIFKDYSFEKCIEKLSEIGYSAIEIRVHEDGVHLPVNASQEQIKHMKKILEDYGFKVSCLAGYKKLGYTWDKAENEIKSMIKIGEMADKFGAPVFRIKVAKYDLSIGYERIRMLFRSQAVKLMEELRSRRINSIPVVEQHGGEDMAHSTGILIDLFRGLDPDRIGIMFDPGNAVKVGWLPIELQIDM